MDRRGVLFIAATGTIATLGSLNPASQASQEFTSSFRVEPGELVSTGRNPYFVLEPGYRLELSDKTTRLVITVLAETKVVDGVETRIVEERETERDKLVEVSRNYFAISRRTNSVFYFGEDVDMYRDGKVVNHEGSWHSGVNGARFGLMMPGLPLLGAQYQQEVAPGVAMDRARVVSTTARLVTPAGAFESVLVTDESSPLEPGAREQKRYAPGVGLVQDAELMLARLPSAGAKPASR